jgi:pimeloyl-ACP methyl ester carboxylesterase
VGYVTVLPGDNETGDPTMTRSPPLLALVHGAGNTGACWDPTIAVLRAQRPDVPVVAVDLPGRRRNPGSLAELTIERAAESVEKQIMAMDPERVVLVGHSLAGLTLPEVANRLGTRLVAMVFISAAVPPNGKSALDVLPFPVAAISRLVSTVRPVTRPMSRWLAVRLFANDMSREQQQFMAEGLVPESARLGVERVRRTAMADVPKTWILTTMDKVNPPARQRKAIERLGGVDTIVELESGHAAMISRPEAVAGLLLDAVDRLSSVS